MNKMSLAWFGLLMGVLVRFFGRNVDLRGGYGGDGLDVVLPYIDRDLLDSLQSLCPIFFQRAIIGLLSLSASA